MYFTDILHGACDVHVHTAPSLMSRELDSFEMARRASKAGYAAIVLKDHHSNTAPVAAEIIENLDVCRLVSPMSPVEDSSLAGAVSNAAGRNTCNASGTDACIEPLKVFGSICLNNAVGGINPFAVEVAILFGAKIIWLPTVSSENHLGKLKNNVFPNSRIKLAESPIRVTDGGRLLPEARDTLRLIAENPGTVLATGHISARDVDAVLDGAVGLGIKSILIDHPTFFIEASRADMQRWADSGAFIEHTATGSLPGSNVFHTDHRKIIELIGYIGPTRTIISSDAGQSGNGCPIEVLDKFLKLLSDSGLCDSDIISMVRENPRKLLGIAPYGMVCSEVF